MAKLDPNYFGDGFYSSRNYQRRDAADRNNIRDLIADEKRQILSGIESANIPIDLRIFYETGVDIAAFDCLNGFLSDLESIVSDANNDFLDNASDRVNDIVNGRDTGFFEYLGINKPAQNTPINRVILNGYVDAMKKMVGCISAGQFRKTGYVPSGKASQRAETPDKIFSGYKKPDAESEKAAARVKFNALFRQ